MAFQYPKVTWPAASPTSTLQFTYPPINKPGPYGVMDQEAVGSISITLSGKRQVMYLRTDQFFRLIFDATVPWADMAAWQTFMQYAQPGGSFLYYPDACGSGYDEYVIEDGGASLRKYKTANISPQSGRLSICPFHLSSFDLVLREVPGRLTHS